VPLTSAARTAAGLPLTSAARITTGMPVVPAARVVAGVGCSRGCPADELRALVDAAVADAGGELAALATIDRRADEPCMLETAEQLGVPLVTHSAVEPVGRRRAPRRHAERR
jgi:cobalt-precorrin 5A hydrolase/precorrin-3B C17-methyltransferase